MLGAQKFLRICCTPTLPWDGSLTMHQSLCTNHHAAISTRPRNHCVLRGLADNAAQLTRLGSRLDSMLSTLKTSSYFWKALKKKRVLRDTHGKSVGCVVSEAAFVVEDKRTRLSLIS